MERSIIRRKTIKHYYWKKITGKLKEEFGKSIAQSNESVR